MPGFFKWLLIFGILAGVGVRAAPHIHAYSHSHPHCDEHHQHGHGGHQHHACADAPLDEFHAPDSEGSHGEHHHQHVCCHISPLAVDGAEAGRLSLLDFSLFAVISEGARAPAEPVFELDTPPLI